MGRTTDSHSFVRLMRTAPPTDVGRNVAEDYFSTGFSGDSSICTFVPIGGIRSV